jgi:predicted metal-dependent phosphoesterase TrpH
MDCQMPLEKIIKKCQKLGINCIAIADREIMGMFLKETIKSEANARITPQEAIKRIREQGALANLQHPFETIRGSALKDKVIEELAGNFDLVEVLNSRSPLPANSNKARAFAEQHHIPGGAGSDAHSLYEIGAAYVEMPDFNTKEEFLQSLAQAKICGRRSSIFVHLFSFWAKIKGKTIRALRGKKDAKKI